MAEKTHSKACCSIPAVVTKGYEPKGRYEDIGGFRTYVTGSPTATKAILYIFDIFGFFPQSLQGADILSSSSSTDYLILMPDFFHGKPVDINIFPPKNDEEKATLGAFFKDTAEPQATAAKIPKLLNDIESKYPSIKDWGVAGFCWGGKLICLLSKGTPEKIKVAAGIHPAFLDPKDGAEIKIPICILASKDENADDVKAFEKALTGEKHVETFADQIHGWMAARSDLSDEKTKKEYERGYCTLLEFFNKHL